MPWAAFIKAKKTLAAALQAAFNLSIHQHSPASFSWRSSQKANQLKELHRMLIYRPDLSVPLRGPMECVHAGLDDGVAPIIAYKRNREWLQRPWQDLLQVALAHVDTAAKEIKNVREPESKLVVMYSRMSTEQLDTVCATSSS